MRKSLLLLLLFIMTGPVIAQDLDANALYEATCTRCHPKAGYVWERSRKAWQACVYTMQDYAADPEFTDEVADTLIDHLTANAAQIEEELYAPSPSNTDTDIAPPTRAPQSTVWATLAKSIGYLSAAALLCSISTGLLRRKLNKRFKLVHRLAAGVLLCAALAHSAYYLATFGMPPLLWFQAGVLTTAVILSTLLATRFRKHFRRQFLKLHKTAAIIGLTALLVHWIWIIF